jgi:hypothetical protein
MFLSDLCGIGIGADCRKSSTDFFPNIMARKNEGKKGYSLCRNPWHSCNRREETETDP